jgi:hypothetical protein
MPPSGGLRRQSQNDCGLTAEPQFAACGGKYVGEHIAGHLFRDEQVLVVLPPVQQPTGWDGTGHDLHIPELPGCTTPLQIRLYKAHVCLQRQLGFGEFDRTVIHRLQGRPCRIWRITLATTVIGREHAAKSRRQAMPSRRAL